MDSEEESASEEAEVESEEESDSGVASLALASAFVAKSIFNPEDNGHDADAEANDDDDSAPTYCFMARGAKVNSRDAYFQTSSEDNFECESKPSYKTLAKIATEQQTAMEHIQKLLDKSDDLLDAEMNRTQSLIEDIKNLHVKYEELESHHETLSATHEKLSYDYLQRKQDLEKLRASHEDLQKENDSLLAQ
jgi:DNA repair exonuclease SbcCD ATPase subunit